MSLCITNQEDYEKLFYDFDQKCDTVQQELSFLLFEDNLGLINTDLDIQRNYVWTAPQEQEMWDTLLLGVRIPEFHALMQDEIYNICDGKQRFTCILRILKDQIPYKRSTAKCQFLFQNLAYKNKHGKTIIPDTIYFSQLPPELQARIKHESIHIAKYRNLDRTEQILLFKKINNGTALSNFAKGLASYYYMRTDFSRFILAHPWFNHKDLLEQNQEDVEVMIIRTLLLIAGVTTSLEQNALENYYPNFEQVTTLVKYREAIYDTLNRIPNFNVITQCRSWRTISPFVLTKIYQHPELNTEDLRHLIVETLKYQAGRGGDLRGARIIENYNFVEQCIQHILKDKSNEAA